MSRRLEVHDLFREALEYGLSVIDALDDDALDALEED
jgi:hypothetical protein